MKTLVIGGTGTVGSQVINDLRIMFQYFQEKGLKASETDLAQTREMLGRGHQPDPPVFLCDQPSEAHLEKASSSESSLKNCS